MQKCLSAATYWRKKTFMKDVPSCAADLLEPTFARSDYWSESLTLPSL